MSKTEVPTCSLCGRERQRPPAAGSLAHPICTHCDRHPKGQWSDIDVSAKKLKRLR